MKKIILLSLLTLITACGTTTGIPEAVSYIETITPAEYFAGSTQTPGTTYTYNKKVLPISESNRPLFQLATRYAEPTDESPQPDKALSILESLVPATFNDYETAFFHRIRGYAYLEKGEHRKAVEAFNLMLAKRDYLSVSAEAKATKTLASLHLALEEHDFALKYMFKSSEFSESLSSADYYQVSLIQTKMGDYKNAIKNVNKAILITGDSSPADTNLYYEHMAKIYEKMNNPSTNN